MGQWAMRTSNVAYEAQSTRNLSHVLALVGGQGISSLPVELGSAHLHVMQAAHVKWNACLFFFLKYI